MEPSHWVGHAAGRSDSATLQTVVHLDIAETRAAQFGTNRYMRALPRHRDRFLHDTVRSPRAAPRPTASSGHDPDVRPAAPAPRRGTATRTVPRTRHRS